MLAGLRVLLPLLKWNGMVGDAGVVDGGAAPSTMYVRSGGLLVRWGGNVNLRGHAVGELEVQLRAG